MVRLDQSDLIYRTEEAKFDAVVDDIVERHEKGQPVLVGTTSVEKSENLSAAARQARHPARGAQRQAPRPGGEIVAQAGRKGAVTVATNMAGRGTDIMLGGNPDFLAEAELRQRGLDPVEHAEEYAAALPAALEKAEAAVKAEHEEVKELGGLYVLGTERHESRRIDNQLRGRSGRQGDPGESRFYLSLGDDLMRLFKAQMVERVMSMANIPDDVPIESKMVTRAIASAQSQVEQQNFEIRKNVLKYDEVLNRQRQVIYGERRRVLEGEDLHEQVRHLIDDTIEAYVQAATAEGFAEEWDLDQLWSAFKQLYPVKVTVEELEEAAGDRAGITAEFLAESIKDDVHEQYEEREEQLGVGDHARAGAPRGAVRARPQVARAPLRDGLPPGGHRPAGDGPARPAGRVPARGLRHVQRHDGRASRRSPSATCSTWRSRSSSRSRRSRCRTPRSRRLDKEIEDAVPRAVAAAVRARRSAPRVWTPRSARTGCTSPLRRWTARAASSRATSPTATTPPAPRPSRTA